MEIQTSQLQVPGPLAPGASLDASSAPMTHPVAPRAAVVESGVLDIGSGRLTICDPRSDRPAAALDRAVPNGRYQVLVSRVSRLVASTLVRFRPASPAQWERAESSLSGYNRITGLMDHRTYELNRDRKDVYDALLVGEMPWKQVTLGTGQDALFVTSAFGDGSSVSYWGLDDDDRVCCLFTDFRMFPFVA